MTIKVEHSFDDKNYRHYLNGTLTVMHCHHYMALATRLAEQFSDIGAPAIMAGAVEDSVRPMFDDYFLKNGVSNIADKMAVVMEYYSVMGMGKMKAKGNDQAGEVVLSSSHMDKGWEMKWDKRDTPMNHWTRGYIAAMFAATFGKPARSYEVEEVEALITGAPQSKFTVRLK
jgi:hypothetical protein